MSCNGCRVLRKGCSDTCILRPCLRWIDSAESQGNATILVAKFFGRAGLMSFLSAVPESHRPALFQSLLFEACGRTVNPVSGAVGLLGSGNWQVCQAAVETVLRGGKLLPFQDLRPDESEVVYNSQKRKRSGDVLNSSEVVNLSLTMSPSMESEESGTSSNSNTASRRKGQRRRVELLDLFC